MHQNALCEQQILLDAKTHVWHNMFQRTFYVIGTGPT
jgi:hypothetical protein